jgi:hypothetical protein
MSSLAERVRFFIGTEKGYTALLKAGAVLIAAWAVGLSQLGPVMWERDLVANSLKFQVEAKMNAVLTPETDCAKFPAVQTECRTALHHMKTLSSSLKLWDRVVSICLYGGLLVFGIGVMGFAMPLLVSQRK